MVEIIEHLPEEEKTMADAVQATVSGIAMLFLQRTLDEDGTIEIPSLGMVLDKNGAGNLIELDKSEYSIKNESTTNE